MHIGVVMDPIESINIKKDSTFAMLLAAQARGWTIYYMTLKDMYIEQGIPHAAMCTLQVEEDSSGWFEKGELMDRPLNHLDCILMRKDPPVDREFLFATHILSMAEKQGVLVVNRPQSLRDCNEKLFATEFPQCCPPVLVSRNEERIRDFYAEHGDIILKPLDSMGGGSIFRVKPGDGNIGVIIEVLTSQGAHQIMAQKFIPEISAGDKRILLIDGEPVPYALARVPMAGENRGNLAAGGTGVAQPLSDRDRWICEQVAPVLKEKGLMFVGIDVIGDYLTEINVTSPTCIRELDRAYNLNIAGMLMDAIAAKLGASQRIQE